MSLMKIIPWILIVVGACVNFLIPIVLKKQEESEDVIMQKIYTVKSIGLIMVIIGCVMIFWLGGRFGV